MSGFMIPGENTKAKYGIQSATSYQAEDIGRKSPYGPKNPPMTNAKP